MDKRRIDAIKAAKRQAEARATWQKAEAEIVKLMQSGGEIPLAKWEELKRRFIAVNFVQGQERPAQPWELFLEYAQRQYEALGGSSAKWAAYGWVAGTSKAVRSIG